MLTADLLQYIGKQASNLQSSVDLVLLMYGLLAEILLNHCDVKPGEGIVIDTDM